MGHLLYATLIFFRQGLLHNCDNPESHCVVPAGFKFRATPASPSQRLRLKHVKIHLADRAITKIKLALIFVVTPMWGLHASADALQVSHVTPALSIGEHSWSPDPNPSHSHVSSWSAAAHSIQFSAGFLKNSLPYLPRVPCSLLR